MVTNLGIRILHSTVGNSRANGQVERMIRTLKDTIRRQQTLNPASYWSDAVPYALLALRMTAAGAHKLPPYTIVTGRYPSLPSHLMEMEVTEGMYDEIDSA